MKIGSRRIQFELSGVTIEALLLFNERLGDGGDMRNRSVEEEVYYFEKKKGNGGAFDWRS